MKRVIWFTVGAAVAVVVVIKGQELLRKATPAGMQEQAAAKANDVAGQARSFFGTLTSAMSERETELRESLGLTEGAAAEADARLTAAHSQARRAATA